MNKAQQASMFCQLPVLPVTTDSTGNWQNKNDTIPKINALRS